MQTITVYSKPDDAIPRCYPCISTKRWLNNKGVEYIVKNLETEENLEFAKSLGHQQSPVVVVETSDGETVTTEHWSGFNPTKLDEHIQL